MRSYFKSISTAIEKAGMHSAEAVWNCLCIDYLMQTPTTGFFYKVVRDHREAAWAYSKGTPGTGLKDIKSVLNAYFVNHELDVNGEFAKMLQMFLTFFPEYTQYLSEKIRANLPPVTVEHGEQKEIINLMLGHDANWMDYFIRLSKKLKFHKPKPGFMNVDKALLEILSNPEDFDLLSKKHKLEVAEAIYQKTKSSSHGKVRHAIKALSRIFRFIPVDGADPDSKEEKSVADLDKNLKKIKRKIAKLFLSIISDVIDPKKEVEIGIALDTFSGFKKSYNLLCDDQKQKLIDLLVAFVQKAVVESFAQPVYMICKKEAIGILVDIANTIVDTCAGAKNKEEILSALRAVLSLANEVEPIEAACHALSETSGLTMGEECRIVYGLLDLIKEQSEKDKDCSQAPKLLALAALYPRIPAGQGEGVHLTETFARIPLDHEEVKLTVTVYQHIKESLKEPNTKAAMEALALIYDCGLPVDKIEITELLLKIVNEDPKPELREAAIKILMKLEKLIPEFCRKNMNAILVSKLREDSEEWSVKVAAFLALHKSSSFPKDLDPKSFLSHLINVGIGRFQEANLIEEDVDLVAQKKSIIENLSDLLTSEDDAVNITSEDKDNVFETFLLDLKAAQVYTRMDMMKALEKLPKSLEAKKKLIEVLLELLDKMNTGVDKSFANYLDILRRLSLHAETDIKFMIVRKLIDFFSQHTYLISNHTALKDVIFTLSADLKKSQKHYVTCLLFNKVNSHSDQSINAHYLHLVGKICEDVLRVRKYTEVMEEKLTPTPEEKNNEEFKGLMGVEDLIGIVKSYCR